MALQPAPYVRQAGQDWLLSCADTPAETRSLWDADELGAFPTGGHWTAGETSLARTMDAVKSIPPARRGPVLADCNQGIAWWLLPPTLTDELDDVCTITVRPRGWLLRCPPVLYPVRGRVWIERPDGSGRLTDPVLLGAALGPGGGPRLSTEAFG
ncbi:hypothetical protein [Streptomyces rhizosphaerihabitans]|uniref:hypothetical protein n=1 Tax=Streptomyces rhizosphaerihabitans TaxID=1266770 RepID=UPI0021BFD734|nr:hypothetical protein [Streptomyces rhizosphaerihabitans]MCT9010017.1 hypothetical protein [Streptomyces rhizosphaerihabitans]